MLSAELRTDGDHAVIDVVETVPLATARRTMFDMFLVGVMRMGPALTDHRVRLEDVELWFDDPEPDYYQRYRDRLPPARFDMGANQLRFPALHLDRRPHTANPHNAKLVDQQCRQELAQLGLTGDIVGQVRALLHTADDGYPTLGEVVALLHTSSRTLKRRLREHGTSFHHLLDTERRAQAIRLLRSTSLSVEQVSARLGYADASSFRRAFRAWTNTTPREFRERQR